MKKISKSISKTYKMPHLYLDELMEIENALKESNPKSYVVIIGDYEYDSINEVERKDDPPIHEMKINSNDPYISITFERFEARVFIYKDDLVSSGIFTKIDKILLKAQRKILWFPSSNVFISAILGGIIGQLVTNGLPFEANPLKILNLLLASLLLIYLIASLKTLFIGYCRIEFIRKSTKRSFIKKYKDQLMLIIFGAIIGAFFTVLFEKIFPKLF